MGSSNPNGQTIFNLQKDIVKGLLELYSPKPNPFISSVVKPLQSIAYGLIVYGDEAVPLVNIGERPDTKQLLAFVDTLTWPGEGKSFEEGLLQAEKLFDKSPNSNPRKVLVLFANDRTEVDSSTLKELAERLTSKGIELRVVAVGNRVDDNQINVLTDGSEGIVIKVSETEQPTGIAKRLGDATAKGKIIDVRLKRWAKGIYIEW
jgi:hypothetical protein